MSKVSGLNGEIYTIKTKVTGFVKSPHISSMNIPL